MYLLSSLMVITLPATFIGHTLRTLRGFLPALTRPDLTCGLSRQERLGLIFSAIEQCGADCPPCAIWALEQDRSQAAMDIELTERRLPC